MYLTMISSKFYDRYGKHREVTSLFPSDKTHPLFSVNGGITKVISIDKPIKDLAFNGAVVNSTTEISIPSVGTMLPFKILFNPRKRSRVNKESKSIRIGIGDSTEATQWLTHRMERDFGVKLDAINCEFRGIQVIAKGNETKAVVATHLALGVLTIIDVNAFSNALINGIGGAKFAGFGLLDIWYASQK